MSDTLFCSKLSAFSKLVPIIANFTGSPIKITHIETLTTSDINRLLGKSPTTSLPVMKVGLFFLSGTLAITKYILSTNKEVEETLLGQSPTKKASTDMWINFIHSNLLPIIDEIYGQTSGQKASSEEIFKIASADLEQELKKVEHYLTFKTFLVDHHVNLADIVLATALFPVLPHLSDGTKKSIPNVLRLFSYVINLKEIASVLSKEEIKA